MLRFTMMIDRVKSYLLSYTSHNLQGISQSEKQNTEHKKNVSIHTYFRFGVVLLLLGVTPTGIASTPWLYQGSIEAKTSANISSICHTVDPTRFDFWLLVSTPKKTTTDYHGLNNNAQFRNIQPLKNSLYDLVQDQFIKTGATATVYEAVLYHYPALSQVTPARITRSKEATPLTVTLNDCSPGVRFGTVFLRQDAVLQPLAQRTSARSQTDIWTLTYGNSTKTGDALVLEMS